MIGFISTSSTFSLAAAQALNSSANVLYIPDNTDWEQQSLPLVSYNITSQTAMDEFGLTACVGDGVTNNYSLLNDINNNVNITNWYIPENEIIMSSTIAVKNHVEAIFGEGTLRSYGDGNTDPEVAYSGILKFNSSGGQANNPNLIIDGLSFDVVPGFISKYRYGCIMFSHYVSNIENNLVEIRNCSFNNIGDINAIKGFGDAETNSKNHNLKIHHNYFEGSGGYFSVELVNWDTTSLCPNVYPNLEIWSNHFDATAGHGAISLISTDVPSGEYIRIHNNKFNNTWGMGIELAEVHGAEIYNNEMLEMEKTTIFDGGTTWGESLLPLKGNIIHHNHMETIDTGLDGAIYFWGAKLVGASDSKVYENFFKCNVTTGLQNIMLNHTPIIPEIYNNTIVNPTDSWSSVALRVDNYGGGTITGGSIHDNDIYNERDWTGISVTDVTADVLFTDNNIYLTGTADCITPGQGTQSGTTCVTLYDKITPPLPTGRPGAGLSDPSNIGPQPDWVANPNPSSPIDITDQTVMTTYGETALHGDGITEDTNRLNSIGNNTSITNWYIPAGKSVLCVGVIPPEHVTHIYGAGTIRRKWTGQTYQSGSLLLRYTVVIDGLRFEEGVGSGVWAGNASMGQILFSGSNPLAPEWSSDGVEIRNCTIDSSDISSDGISVFTGSLTEDGLNKHKNLTIYNTVFEGNTHFAAEIGDRDTRHTDTQDGLMGLEVWGNTINNGNGFSLSRLRVNSAARCHNNTFNDCKWAVEITSCDGLTFNNNLVLNATTHSVVESGPQDNSWGVDLFPTIGTNFVHHNHIETTGIHELNFITLYAGNNSEWYGNYLHTPFKIEHTEGAMLPPASTTFRDNTIISDDGIYSWVIKLIDGGSSIFSNNEIYGNKSTVMNGIAAYTSTGTTSTGDNIYLKNGGSCVLNITQSSGSCDLSYIGTPPPSRLGAGLE